MEIEIKDPVTGQPIRITVPQNFGGLDPSAQQELIRAEYNRLNEPITVEVRDPRDGAMRSFDMPAGFQLMSPEGQQARIRELMQTVVAPPAVAPNPDGTYGTPPPGAIVHGADGRSVHLDTGLSASTPQDSADLPMAMHVLQQRAQGNTLPLVESPFVNTAQKSLGMDRIAEALGRDYAAEMMHQQADQYGIDHPLRAMGAQVVGQGSALMTGGGVAAKVAPRFVGAVASLGSRLAAAPRAVQTASLAGSGVAYGAIDAALASRSGEESQGVADFVSSPTQVGIAAASGPALAVAGRGARAIYDAVGRRRNPPQLIDYIPDGDPLPDLPSGAGAPTSARADASREVLQRAERAAATERTGITVPYGVVYSPEGYMARMSGVTGQPLRRPAQASSEELEQYLAETARKVGTPPVSTGAASNSLRTSLEQSMEAQRRSLSDDYTRFFSETLEADAVQPLDEILGEAIERVATRREAEGVIGIPEQLSNVASLYERGVASVRGLHDARSRIREYIRDPARYRLTQSDVSDLEGVNQALTRALETAIRGASSQPEEAVRTLARLDVDYREISQEMADLSRRVAGADDSMLSTVQQAFATGGDDAVSRLRGYRERGGEDFDNLLALTVERLGAGTRGFDGSRFASNWGRLSQDAKEAMFDPEHLQALDDVATLGDAVQRVASKADSSRPVTEFETAMAGITALPSGATVNTLAIGSLLSKYARSRFMARPATAKALAKFMKDVADSESLDASARTLAQRRAASAFYSKLRSLGVDVASVGASYAAGAAASSAVSE